MHRFQIIKDKLSGGFVAVSDRVPQFGADFAFETPCPISGVTDGEPTSRNRWSRPDLASAIGRDPDARDTDDVAWPPANR
jgi:hypothetical protein